MNKKLERYAQELLDTGKRNNMINFRDTKASTVEVVYPSGEDFFTKCLATSVFEIYDPKIEDDEDDEEAVYSANTVLEEAQLTFDKGGMRKNDYISYFSSRIRKANQILVHANIQNPIVAIKNIEKKSRDFIEETGVNVAHLAFGFVHWREKENSQITYKAPLLLLPITLKNESAVAPHYIELMEEEIIVNPTFSYFLNAQYGITLPEYLDEEPLYSYISRVQDLVSKLHWQVTSECKLGIFSFLKINMYYDLLNNHERILSNDNVRLLLGESTRNASFADDPAGLEHVGNEIIDLHTVVDADSSQLEAIEMVKSGRSFVLQGPPGTGKSQTITNIIAECLHDNKKVLFVSEKLAALNVVYDKLKQVGLEEFCLELHSHKSSKKKVITELCKTLKADRSIVSPRADAEVQAKARLQAQLDAYAEELHKPIPGINKSVYQLYDAHSTYRNAPNLEFVISDIAGKDETFLDEAVNLLSQYEQYITTIGDDYHENEWYGYRSEKSSYEAKNALKQNLQVVVNSLRDLVKAVEPCKTEFSLIVDTLHDVDLLVKLLNVISQTISLRPAALNQDAIETLISALERLRIVSQQMAPFSEKLNGYFKADIYGIDAADCFGKLTVQYGKFFSRLFNAEYKKLIADIRLASKTGGSLEYATAKDYMKTLLDYQNLERQFEADKVRAAALIDVNLLSIDTKWEPIIDEAKTIKAYYEDGLNCGNIEMMTDEEFNLSKSAYRNYIQSIEPICTSIAPVLSELQNDFDKELFLFESMTLTSLTEKMQQCILSIDKVDNWVRFNILLEQLKERGLLSFIDFAIQNNIRQNQVAATYQKLFYNQWINYAICENPVLANFTRISQDRAVEQFAQKDRLQFEISKAQIKAEISAKRPSLDMMAGGSEVAILVREGEKKRKQKGIRRLLVETGNLIQAIKPCFLMSPLSVSTFLDSDNITFDTVIFDEASQIFPQDAIGAIYRSKQLIVVGDSRQMPPSNFFNSSVDLDNDDEEVGDITDFESILDLCSVSLPQLRLKWHYRSRYEQLIAFSNKNFYDSSLVTFPSTVTDREGIGVDYYYVDGVFDRKSHTNRKEAEFIVDLVYKNIEKYPNRSLGVVAFSVAQQDLIERLLSRKRQEDTSKEWFFKHDDATKEPFFVKNLETVQGDERDTIIFSVAYGIDSQGRLLHNFGPLNRIGGERRLNVAVTRAKCNVALVSSMHATDIDLSRTSAEGARLLREYIDYAENGTIALERTISVNPFEQFDSEFEMDVCDFLRENGFAVDTQVGCSGFRIDLGLKKPDSSDYVLAIECDGATYHSSKNARDRDRLRQEVLERMGWRFYRIWSTDWFRNTAVEKERLLHAATEAINLGGGTKDGNKSKAVSEAAVLFEKAVAPKHLHFPEYEVADDHEISCKLHTVQSVVKAIMEIEAPISEEFLLKRISYIYGREKVTKVVKQRFDYDMRGCGSSGIIRRNGFLYLANKEEFVLRVPGDSEEKRDIKYIAPEELAAGLLTILQQNYSAEKEGLYKTLLHQLGFNRITDQIWEKFDEAIGLLHDVIIEGNNVSLKQ